MGKIKHIHFIGIKGVGMTPLAIIAKEAGFRVTGCDIGDSFITDKLLKKKGIYPSLGFNTNHLTDVDLVITTGAHGGKSNPEVREAEKQKIPVLMQGQAVGEFMKGTMFSRELKGISVAGCHGKTTTTALVATLLKSGGYDPSFIIGTGDIPSLGVSGHFGSGDYFVAEADEYATELTTDRTPKFLWQYPRILVITNIEFDHPDVYENIEQIETAYAKLEKNIRGDGVLIANGDDKHINKILENTKSKKILFGFNSNNTYRVSYVRVVKKKTFFTLSNKKGFTQEFAVHAIGTHNALNAVAALLVAKEVGLADEEIQKGLFAFRGTKRRLEFKGTLASGAELYDDYAHHPTEINATLAALHALYPDKKIIAVFQPHTYSRTKKLFEEFITSFGDAYEVVLTDIYASQRESYDPSISAKKLGEALERKGKRVVFVQDTSSVVQYIREKMFDASYCLVTMGAGDIYKIEVQLRKENLL